MRMSRADKFLMAFYVMGFLLSLFMVADAIVTHASLKPTRYVSPAYCWNDQDNFKSDVCSKIGKQWSL